MFTSRYICVLPVFCGECWSVYLQKEAITEEEQNENTPAVTSPGERGGEENKEEVVAQVAQDESSEEPKEEEEAKEDAEDANEAEVVQDSVIQIFG